MLSLDSITGNFFRLSRERVSSLVPMQNGFVESFNGRMRDELLNETLFFDLDDARTKIAVWVTDFNTARPHSALGNLTPAA